MAFDTVQGRPVLFGGTASQPLNGVWQYDTTADRWLQLEPAQSCPSGVAVGRSEYALEYEPLNQLFWIFGGTGFGCADSARIAGKGTTTTAIRDDTLPGTTVDFYKGWTVTVGDTSTIVSAYNPAIKTLSLATALAGAHWWNPYVLSPPRGGGTFSYSAVTKSWGTGTGSEPANRLSPAMAYSTRDAAIVMFGGQGLNDTWALDVRAKQWRQVTPGQAVGSPPGLAELSNSMVYDSENDVFVLFGGCLCTGNVGQSSGDTWAYRLSTNSWTRMTPPVSPPARQGHNLVYDSANKRVVLFGGFDAASGTYYNDLWIYSFATNAWTMVFPPAAPPARRVGAMVYDPVQQRTVLYGGKGPESLTDVWSLQLKPPATGGSTPALTSLSPNSGSTPALTSLSPNSVTAGSPSFTLTVTGANFGPSSVLRWNGISRPTTYVRSTQVQTSVSASDVVGAGTAQVSVSATPGSGGGTSNFLAFTVVPPAPLPALSSISPVTVSAGGSAFTLTATGTGFTTNSVVRVNGSSRTTTFVSATQLTATILATDIASSGSRDITVLTPAPGGGTSSSVTLMINNPGPTVSSIAPASLKAWGLAFALTVTGSGFVSTSTVQIDGAVRPTTYVSSAQLTAAIPASDLATGASNLAISVNTPSPGGGTSNAASLALAQPALSVSATSATPSASVTATLSNPPGNASDTIALALVGSAVTSSIQTVAVSSLPGTTSKAWAVTMPATPGQYEFRFFPNNGSVVATTSSAVTIVASANQAQTYTRGEWSRWAGSSGALTFRQAIWVGDGRAVDFKGTTITPGVSFGEYRGGTGNVVFPFTGYGKPGALDTTRKRIVTTRAGGHGAWAMFEVDELDWATGTWNPDGRPQNPYTRIVRLPPPTYVSGEYFGGLPDTPQALLDPNHYYDSYATVDPGLGVRVFPNAIHTGDSFRYMPSVNRFVSWGGFATDWSGNSGQPWPIEWDPATKKWSSCYERGADNAAVVGDTTTSVLAWDSTENWMLHYRGMRFYRYNPAAACGSRIALLYDFGSLVANEQGSLLYDSKRKRAVYLTYGTSNGGSFYLDMSSNPNAPTMTHFAMKGDITNGTLYTKHPAWEYDPIGDRYLLWIGGKTIYWVNPDTFVATAYTPSGGIDPGTRRFGDANGAYLLEYLPGDDVFIGVNNADTNGFEVFAPLRAGTSGPGTGGSGAQGGTAGSADGGLTPTDAASLTLTYNGMLRDRVGQGNTALAPDGVLDGTLTVTLSAPGGRTVTGLRLDSNAPGTWDTSNATMFWVLAVAPSLDGALLNAPGTMAVSFPVADGGSFVVFASDYQGGEFLSGRTLTLTTTFSDGSTATAATTVTGPTVTVGSVTPNQGTPGAAVPVTVNGTGFAAGATLNIAGTGVTVSNVAVPSATQLTATLTIASGAALGARDVSVTNAGGGMLAGGFTVVTAAASVSVGSGGNAGAGSPQLAFSDLLTGPRSGNPDTSKGQTAGVDGAIITVWGYNLGSSQGSSTITVGGIAARAVYYWGNATPPNCGAANLYNTYQKLQCVIFQIAGATPTGAQNIVVTVNGQTASLPFTVASSGRITYVSSAGTFQAAVDGMASGDIVYVMDGVRKADGITPGYNSQTPTAPLAIVAYPGATVSVGDATHDAFPLTHSGTGHWMIYSKLNIMGAGAAVALQSNARLVGSKLQSPLGVGSAGIVGSSPYIDSFNLAILGNEFTNCGDPANLDSLYHVVYLSGIRGAPAPTLETDREVGWNYFHDNAATRAINIFNGMPNSNPISRHRVHDNVIVNQLSDGILLSKGVVGENWIYNNLIITAGKGPAGAASYGAIYLHAGWSGLGWGSMPDSAFPKSATTLHVYNNTIINAGFSGSSSGAWLITTTADWTPDIHNNLTYQTNGQPYVASGSDGQSANSAQWSNNLWYGAGAAPAFDSRPVSADPLLVSAGGTLDLHLQAGSPARGAGIVVTSPSLDFDGVRRPSSGTWDIGAYQSAAGSGSTVTAPLSPSIALQPPSTSTVTLVVTGDPSTGPYAVEAQTTAPGPLTVTFFVDGTLFGQESVPKYCIVVGDAICAVGILGAGTHAIKAQVFQQGGTVVLAETQITLTESSSLLSPASSSTSPLANVAKLPTMPSAPGSQIAQTNALGDKKRGAWATHRRVSSANTRGWAS